MTVSSNEAETLGYLEYKLLVWSRLVDFWIEFKANHPDWSNRLEECRLHLRHWQDVEASERG